jgi:CheY-like chemotaxis protein
MGMPLPWHEKLLYQSWGKIIFNNNNHHNNSTILINNKDSSLIPSKNILSSSSSSSSLYYSQYENNTTKGNKSYMNTYTNKKSKSVKFSNTVLCILVPSRDDLMKISSDIWWDENEISSSRIEAENDLKHSLSSNESNLTLYSAMNMIYRPCIKDNKSQFRMLIVDDSYVCRKLLMFNIKLGHRSQNIKENLILQQAGDIQTAMEQVKTRFYNVIVIDYLLANDERGTSLIEEIKRLNLDNIVLIGTSSLLTDKDPLVIQQTKQLLMDSGADIVWPKPVKDPIKAWEELMEHLPLEF